MSKGETRVYTEETTHFLNVDVEVRSRSRLDVLAAALPGEVFVQYLGKAGGVQFLSLSLSHIASKSSNRRVLARRLDALARRMAVILSGVGPPARSLWDAALSRTFDVGIQAGCGPQIHELWLEHETISLLSSLRARVAITTYGAVVRARGPGGPGEPLNPAA